MRKLVQKFMKDQTPAQARAVYDYARQHPFAMYWLTETELEFYDKALNMLRAARQVQSA